MTTFTLAVGPSSGSGPVQQVTDFGAWSLENNLDDGCTITFDARGNGIAASFIDEMATDVWLFQDSTLIDRQRVVSVSQQWGPDGDDEISVQSVCYRRILRSRHVRSLLTYTGVDQSTIVWNLISHAQAATNGSLGITLGTSTAPAVNRDRRYGVGTNIFDAITEFTQIDQGIQWDITPALVLNITAQGSGSTIAQPLEIGVTARQMARPSSAQQFGNAVIVTGNDEDTLPYLAEAPSLATDPRGRWERFAAFPGGSFDQALVEAGDGLLQTFISPVAVWDVEMEPRRYFSDAEAQIGDLVTIVQPRSTVYPVGTPAPTIPGQVLARRITQDADGELTVSLRIVEVPSP